MANSAVENDLGCGVMAGIFHRRIFPTRKTSLNPILTNPKVKNINKIPSTLNSKIPQQGIKPPPLKASRTSDHHQNHRKEASRKSSETSRRPSTDASRSSTTSSNNSTLTKVSQSQDIASLKVEVSVIIHNQGDLNGNKGLVLANSSNAKVLGHMGNLGNNGNINSKTGNKKNKFPSTGNIMKRPNYREIWVSKNDPEMLKNMGNEEFKKGRFEEALVLYNQAIRIDPCNVAYHCNKAAALACLGQLLEAVVACREAIRIEPFYHKAHHRLATLYIRLGETEKAMYHYKYSSPQVNTDYTAQVQAIQTHLNRCSEAHKLRDWNTLLKETKLVISQGVDSAPQINAYQAEALLKLNRHQEAYAVFEKRPTFELDSSIELFGLKSYGYVLMIQAQLYMVMGRLEESIDLAQDAARIDSTNEEVTSILRRIRAVVAARLKGNLLYNASKFSEACSAYTEGLEHDPYNSLLLCNRAACRFTLNQFEKAVEDCDAALCVRPSYSKARLRRANCNAKLERWKHSIQDYEMLLRKSPRDEEVAMALFDAQNQLKRENGE